MAETGEKNKFGSSKMRVKQKKRYPLRGGIDSETLKERSFVQQPRVPKRRKSLVFWRRRGVLRDLTEGNRNSGFTRSYWDMRYK